MDASCQYVEWPAIAADRSVQIATSVVKGLAWHTGWVVTSDSTYETRTDPTYKSTQYLDVSTVSRDLHGMYEESSRRDITVSAAGDRSQYHASQDLCIIIKLLGSGLHRSAKLTGRPEQDPVVYCTVKASHLRNSYSVRDRCDKYAFRSLLNVS